VRLIPHGKLATGGPIVPAPDGEDGDDESEAAGGIRILHGIRSSWRKPAPVPLC
jgi:hypothetical protein